MRSSGLHHVSCHTAFASIDHARGVQSHQRWVDAGRLSHLGYIQEWEVVEERLQVVLVDELSEQVLTITYNSKNNYRNLIQIRKYTQTFQIYKLSFQILRIVEVYLGYLPSDFSRNSGYQIRTTPSEGVGKCEQLQQCEVTVSADAG